MQPSLPSNIIVVSTGILLAPITPGSVVSTIQIHVHGVREAGRASEGWEEQTLCSTITAAAWL
jgi:energy-converting hydrogenase Eha subunit G